MRDARAGQHQINAASAGAIARAAGDFDQRRRALPLGEGAERLFPNAGNSGEGKPFIVCRIDHDWIAVARPWIFHRPPVHVLPDRLIGVGVAAASGGVVPAKNAAGEGAEFLEFLGARLHLLPRQVAAAASAAELQHRRRRAAFRVLRPVGGALGKIAERTRRHLAVAVEIHRAFELKAELIEIMPVARRGKIALEFADVELEIARCTRRAIEQMPIVECSAAVLQPAFPFDLVGLYEFHHHVSVLVGAAAIGSFHRDGDDRRHDRRIKGNMRPMAEHELQRVLTRRQRHNGFGLPAAEMDVLGVGGDRLLQFLGRERRVDDEMVMAGLGLLDASRRYPHAGQAKLDLEGAGDGVAILRTDDVDGSAGRGGGLTQRHGRNAGQRDNQQASAQR